MLKDSKLNSKNKMKNKNIKENSESELILANYSKKFKQKNLMDLKGKISFLPDYDYKKMRENK